ncbi:MAG TPA: hypothetical protein VEA78_08715 [Acidimicrobiales bacterium]|nr:hypothetical protein [Acidimicrobiales bacterium]
MQAAVVLGHLDDDLAAEVDEHLAAHGGSQDRDFGTVVAVLRDDDGRVVGTGSAHDTTVAIIGDRRFWHYRAVLAPGLGDDAFDELFLEAYHELGRQHVPGGAGPVGLFVVVDDEDVIARRTEAVWPRVELYYAGYYDDGRQARLRYFAGALTGRDPHPDRPTEFPADWKELWPLEPGYSAHPYPGDGNIGADDVIDMWVREGALSKDEAARRIEEVRAVGLAPDGSVCGVATVYVQHEPQLRMDLWAFRSFTAAAHRRSGVAFHLVEQAAIELGRRWEAGLEPDLRGGWSVTEHAGMRRMFPQAMGVYSPSFFLRERPDGSTINVTYAAGATVPPPPGR